MLMIIVGREMPVVMMTLMVPHAVLMIIVGREMPVVIMALMVPHADDHGRAGDGSGDGDADGTAC